MQVADKPIPIEEERKKRALPKIDLNAIVNSPAFIPALLITAGITTVFWSLFAFLYPLWRDDEYFSHGFLVPLISGYIVYRNWDKLREKPVTPGWVGLLFLVPILYIAAVAHRTEIIAFQSLALIGAMLTGVWVIAGFRWMLGLFAPIAYLAFALPIYGSLIDRNTMPLQQASSAVAHQMLKLFGFDTYLSDPTTIMLPHYTLNVAVPCSGLKLVLALAAFAAFFMLIARLKWWANLIFAGSVLPLALFINGLRIMLIGVVGNQWGEEAAASFHDYSGYITLIVCFFILFKGARILGWKD